MNENYYVGLDIGTNSIGYAVTDTRFNLLKYRGEPMWGAHVFEEGKQCADRRSYRTSRRRLDRRQQRVYLTQEIFAKAISEVDGRFFIRLKESALFREDTSGRDTYIFFQDETYTDKDYYREYPTIHHLIKELMEDKKPHDVRLVYLAVAWLMAHRGHFLSEVNKDNIEGLIDFDSIYDGFMQFFPEKPWVCEDKEKFKSILLTHKTVRDKESRFHGLLYGGKKPKAEESDLISKEGLVKLLAGGTVEAGKLFRHKEIKEKISISLKKSEEDFHLLLSELDEDDAECLLRLRAIYDWALLVDSLHGCSSISEAKVKDYEQHKEDLRKLKKFVRKYCPDEYNTIFKKAEATNYAAYAYNVQKAKRVEHYKKASQEEFCDYLKKKLKDITCDPDDRSIYQDITSRLDTYTFMPKQVNGDNRVIPYQLYYYELKNILKNAEAYLPFLSEIDDSGISNTEKLLSVFEFRIPYYVGPLCPASEHAWIVRKAQGKIYPWNFEEKVDLDKSEDEFIRRMTNSCSYLPGETVLPQNSLLYCKFTVLNEINNIKINGNPIPIEAKQGIYGLFKDNKKVTVEKIKKYLKSNNYMQSCDVIGGIDVNIKASLKSYHDFKRLLKSGILSEPEAERIIECMTYSEERHRILRRLELEFPKLSEEDRKYLSKIKYTGFGRLSRKLLTGIRAANKETGESFSIIQALWETNDNLMQLLSGHYTFKDIIEELQREYYSQNPQTIDSLLDEMYISNAVKRPIYRTLDIIKDIKNTCKRAPEKIYVEMARGDEEKKERTKSRKDQILELYKNPDNKAEVRELSKLLEGKEERELRSEVLFLYFMQLGKSMYSGKPIDIEKLKTGLYDVDHIYPQSAVKDDSLSNKVLVLAEENREKQDRYPIKPEIRAKMAEMWRSYRERGLISDEKYRRLTRSTPFSSDEKREFINRQLVETRQSTKAVTRILKHIFPETEIVFVKAGLVADFRNEVLKAVKSRSVNDLHHAKDAYLNIVAGEVYNARFNSRFFKIDEEQYSVKTSTIFGNKVYRGKDMVWDGQKDIARIKKIILKNHVHYTRYVFERRGGLFDQQPLKAAPSLIERKAGLDTEKYGGYRKPTASCFMLAKYTEAGKKPKEDVMVVPIDLMETKRIMESKTYAEEYVGKAIAQIINKPREMVQNVSFPLGDRKIKVNTLLSFDGFEAALASKSSGGKTLVFGSMMALMVDENKERYIKRLESFAKKKELNKKLKVDEAYDKITKADNTSLYSFFKGKLETEPFNKIFRSQLKVLKDGEGVFEKLTVEEQIDILLNILSIFQTGRTTGCNLKVLGGAGQAAIFTTSSKLSNWKSSFKDVRIIDTSAAGLNRKVSQNLLELL